VGAERVRRADDGVGRNQPQCTRGDPVVLAHVGGASLVLLAAGEVAPQRQRAEQVVPGESDDDHDRRDRDPRRKTLRAEDRGRDQHRDQARGVVEADRCLRGRGGEEVDRELRNGRDQCERCEHDEQSEREHELREVTEPAPGGGRRDDLPRVGERGVHDATGRAADLAVAREEARRAGAVEVRDHDLDRDERRGDPGRGDGGSRPAAPVGERVPDPEARHHERDLLLRGRGDDRARRERQQPALVEEPDREEQQWARERDRVELVQRQPLRRGVDQVREGEAEGGAVRAEVLAGEPEDG